MAGKKLGRQTTTPVEPESRQAVTPERFTRLYRLVQILGAGPEPRSALIEKLGFDVRGFYRDLEVLRASGIEVQLASRRYSLVGDVEVALTRLPFPDPHLNLGEVRQLALGRTRTHRRLRDEIERLLG
jgi:hypothetical protein